MPPPRGGRSFREHKLVKIQEALFEAVDLSKCLFSTVLGYCSASTEAWLTSLLEGTFPRRHANAQTGILQRHVSADWTLTPGLL